MFGRSESRGYGRLFGLVGGLVAGGVAVASAIPSVKKRAFRATTILKKDHRVVSGLLWSVSQTTNPTIRKSIFNQIHNHVDTHATVEEEIFYPAVRHLYTNDAEHQVNEAFREHQDIRDLLKQISAIDASSFEFMSKVNELKEKIEHHVEEEERGMFPMVHRNMSNEELEHLGRRMHERKGHLKERMAA
jgi:hemerythrin-like domain-containing protein